MGETFTSAYKILHTKRDARSLQDTATANLLMPIEQIEQMVLLLVVRQLVEAKVKNIIPKVD